MNNNSSIPQFENKESLEKFLSDMRIQILKTEFVEPLHISQDFSTQSSVHEVPFYSTLHIDPLYRIVKPFKILDLC